MVSAEHARLDEIAAAVNEISTYLAHEQIRDATDLDKCLVPDSNGGTQVDVITFYKVRGHPEARVLQAIAEEFFGLVVSDQTANEAQESRPTDAIEESLTVLVEDQSTNCGANASMTKGLLARHGIHNPHSIIVAQDPTMCRRTAASFGKLYEADAESRPQILCWPTFVPRVTMVEAQTVASSGPLSQLTFQTTPMSGPDPDDLWEMPRFADLIMGEIPRLRDTVDGYGPRGKGFISHVDVPPSVENAWRILRSSLGSLERAT
ncbi:hypothetical protein KJ359_010015 [Pestalotiopsis sp. 9143b]|nr:hypothetical protein KJ359_010015 [Pestalotiopsis sp. 9143b]